MSEGPPAKRACSCSAAYHQLQRVCRDEQPTLARVRDLVENRGAPVCGPPDSSVMASPLAVAAVCIEDDAECDAIISYLKQRGASVDAATPDGCTMLMYACDCESLRPVARLLRHGANPRIVDRYGYTALSFAVHNVHGLRAPLVAALQEHGADMTTLAVDAFAISGAAMRDVEPYIPEAASLVRHYPSEAHHDPLGVMNVAAQRYGFDPKLLPDYMTGNALSADLLWACLRASRGSALGSDFFSKRLCNTPDVAVWRVVARHYGPHFQHPATGDTLLHVACVSPHAAAVLPCLMQLGANPLLRNNAGLLPRHALLAACDYATWRPTPVHTSWYGPFFVHRALSLLLVCRRAFPHVPRDVRMRLLQWVAVAECTSMEGNK